MNRCAVFVVWAALVLAGCIGILRLDDQGRGEFMRGCVKSVARLALQSGAYKHGWTVDWIEQYCAEIEMEEYELRRAWRNRV